VPFLEPVRLTGHLVVLEPLLFEHHDELVAAASDGRLWELWYTSVPDPGGMRAEIDRLLVEQAAGTRLPFTTRRADTGQVIGMTTYLNVDPLNRRLEIGSTWNAESAQRSGTNAESKLLLLGHAFETLDCIAVEFRTHWHNRQSRAAIERLGAKQDGVLRSHQRMANGSLRDTVVYSIVAPEWPAVRAELQRRLAAHGHPEA
jgi:RimJ/RimL family protein N-acetyltransferase